MDVSIANDELLLDTINRQTEYIKNTYKDDEETLEFELGKLNTSKFLVGTIWKSLCDHFKLNTPWTILAVPDKDVMLSKSFVNDLEPYKMFEFKDLPDTSITIIYNPCKNTIECSVGLEPLIRLAIEGETAYCPHVNGDVNGDNPLYKLLTTIVFNAIAEHAEMLGETDKPMTAIKVTDTINQILLDAIIKAPNDEDKASNSLTCALFIKLDEYLFDHFDVCTDTFCITSEGGSPIYTKMFLDKDYGEGPYKMDLTKLPPYMVQLSFDLDSHYVEVNIGTKKVWCANCYVKNLDSHIYKVDNEYYDDVLNIIRRAYKAIRDGIGLN